MLLLLCNRQLSCSNTFVDLNMPPSSGLESPTVIESKGYQCTTIPVINHIRHKMTTPADVLKSISMNLVSNIIVLSILPATLCAAIS